MRQPPQDIKGFTPKTLPQLRETMRQAYRDTVLLNFSVDAVVAGTTYMLGTTLPNDLAYVLIPEDMTIENGLFIVEEAEGTWLPYVTIWLRDRLAGIGTQVTREAQVTRDKKTVDLTMTKTAFKRGDVLGVRVRTASDGHLTDLKGTLVGRLSA
jgi:hypothetical protein